MYLCRVDNKLKKVAFHTLGCKLNFAETSTIARDLLKEGYIRTDFSDMADVYIINTCSVTENADKECRQLIKKINEQQPAAIVVITGCYAQLKPTEIAEIPGVDLVLGTKEKFNISAILDSFIKGDTQVHSCEIEKISQYESAYSIGDRTRAFLKIQDGCDYKCTYCTIPQARGVSRSDSLENIIEKAYEIAQQGVKEIVLTGVNIGDYGKGEWGDKKHENTFLDLIEALDKIESINRIRISSIEPNLLKNEIISFVAHSHKIVPHFHIPLQSGSNHILKQMKRRYLREVYEERVAYIKNHIPDACIGVDVIVGFPGETHEKFIDTYQFINQLDVSYLHVFTYSERPNTEAISMPGIVEVQERKKRNKMLRILSEKKRMAFYQSQLGKSKKVLFEYENKGGEILGFTDNYIRVAAPYHKNLVNQEIVMDLLEIDEKGRMVTGKKELNRF